MTYEQCLEEATSSAHTLTEEDVCEFGMAESLYQEGDEKRYSDEARILYDEHFSRELQRLMRENKVTEPNLLEDA